MKIAFNLFFVVALCDRLICLTYGQNLTDAANLKTALFTTNSYDPKIRPIINQSVPIDVFVEFTLLNINELDEVTETLKTTGFLTLYWKDDLLTWTPADYGGIAYYMWPQNDVWKPDVALKNSHLDYKQLGDSSLNVEVDYQGIVRWSPFQVFRSTCSMDITYFPYDTQVCSLQFIAWSYTNYEVLFGQLFVLYVVFPARLIFVLLLKWTVGLQVSMAGGQEGIVMDEYQSNSAWDVTGSSWKSLYENSETSIVFVITLKRKPLYNMLTLVFPLVTLGILNLFVFLLPSDGGEKAGYSITVFLAFAVFLTIMESSFPENSETIAYFAIYVVIQTVQSIVITLVTLILIRFASFDENTKIPSYLITLARFSKCKTIRKGVTARKVTPGPEKDIITLEYIESNQEKQKDFVKDSSSETSEEEIYSWKYIANALDIFFFFFFGFVFVVSTIVCMLIAQFG